MAKNFKGKAKLKGTTATDRFDLEATVTQKIIDALEKGTRPWQKPWTGTDSDGLPLSASTGKPYKGINVFILWLEQMTHGYESRYWFTMSQIRSLGARLKVDKTRKYTSSIVIFAKKLEKMVEDKDDPTKEKKIAFWYNKFTLVWNADQIEGLPEKYTKPVVVDNSAKARLERIEHAEEFFAKVGATVKHGGSRAFFRPAEDFIQMPNFDDFKNAEAYYATLGHEHIHWTGHANRLKRKFGDVINTDAYAKEELVAEIGAAILCAGLGIESNLREDHAAYIASWLKELKNDKKLIFVASAQAQKGVDFLAKFSQPVEATEDATAAAKEAA